MHSILIQVETPEQIKAIENIAKAMNLPYKKEKLKESNFMSDLNKAKKVGLNVKQAREKSLANIERLWKKVK
jgi:hypothetical protein